MARWPDDFQNLAEADADLRALVIAARHLDAPLVAKVSKHIAALRKAADSMDGGTQYDSLRATIGSWRPLLRARGANVTVPIPPPKTAALREMTAEEFRDHIAQARNVSAKQRARAEVSNILLEYRGASPKFLDPDNVLDLDDLTLANCRLSGIAMSSFRFTSSTNFATVGFENCSFDGVVASGTVFTDGLFNGCTFTEAELDASDFSRSRFSRCKFTGGSLDEANFSSVRMEHTSLTGLRDAPLSARETVFANTLLGRFSADRVDLSRAIFVNVRFELHEKGVKPTPPTFASCDLSGAHFIRTGLKRASFAGSTLEGIHFDEVDLALADFQGVTITAGGLTGATNIDKVKNFPQDAGGGAVGGKPSPTRSTSTQQR